MELDPAPAALPPEEGVASPAERATPGPARAALVRGLHWLPVLACMVLFAQIALFGLRPALSERRRLIEAETVLRERHARDIHMRAVIATNLRARHDPIYQERLRRSRELAPAPPSEPAREPARETAQ